MVGVVGIHGIAQEYRGPNTLQADWVSALQDGMTIAGAGQLDGDDLGIVFYGELFRPAGSKAAGIPPYTAADVADGFEKDLLEAFLLAAMEGCDPEARTKARTPSAVQKALYFLSQSPFFAGLTERLIIGLIKQVHAYLADASLRDEIQERVARAITPETAVVIGHSLGSVIAYEAACAHPEWDLSLVTLGSPLGIRNLIFERLLPSPVNGHGQYPTGVAAWTNIADSGDVVALAKKLAPLFGDQVDDVLIHNGSKAHDVRPYLTAAQTGRAVADGLKRRVSR
jgi:hypothetical protein